MRGLLRLTAEHEAAHAVVARHLGHMVTRAWASDHGSGGTEWDARSATAAEQAAVSAAGDVWCREFGSVEYVDLACVDLATFEREHGLATLWSANRAARTILQARRAATLALADRLVAERSITFGTRARRRIA